MKKISAVLLGVFLLCSAQARAECFVGMLVKHATMGVSICDKCIGGQCSALIRPGNCGISILGCERVAMSNDASSLKNGSCAQCVSGKVWDGKRCVCKSGTYSRSEGLGDKWGKSITLYRGSAIVRSEWDKCDGSCGSGFKLASAVCTDCWGGEHVATLCAGTRNAGDSTCDARYKEASEVAKKEKIAEHVKKYGVYCTAWTCKAGYYKTNQDNGYCQPCPTIANGTCTACSNGTTCTAATCNSGYAWNGSSCARLNCSAGQYLSGNSCVSCPSGQWSSGGTATGCQPCSSISVANGKCTACSASGSCTSVSCNGGYKASGASCVQVSCAAGQRVNGNSCVSCPSGQWSAGGTATACQPCSSVSVANGTCTACSTTGVCSAVSCDRKYVFRNGACALQKCFSNTYEDSSGNCRPCSDIAVNGGVCASCSYDGTLCESVACNEGWANDTAASCTPTKQCAEGGFWDEETQSCKRCDTYMVPNGGCVACNASGCTKAECDKANMTFSEADQKCGVDCEPNQYLDASFACQACPSGQYSVGGRASEATSCTSCSSIAVEGGTCVECSNGECTKASCSTGYRQDETGKKCLKNAANCMDGLSVTADGCCCAK